ncbi:hypothetical protein EDB92DRAFT_277766 [Lactarius akahatsu]|uniref:Uncharacterized protein n=1 Tax=Lactarius akahatsu TaxID=416441 RepID=A0AAD4LJJ4_9AGAM|nr:hypothetical protein EDB92DRAFT_277766 [Lactarius akahatsu]
MPDWDIKLAWDTSDTGPICQTLGSLAVGGVAGRSPSARIAIMLSVGGELPENIRSLGLAPEFGPLIGRNCVGAALSAVPFGRELWTARFCVVAQHSTYWVPGSSGTGKSWWTRVAGFLCKYHAVALASSRRSSAGRFGGACVIVVSLAVSEAPIFKLQGASLSSLLAQCLSLCSVLCVLCVVHAYVAVLYLRLCLDPRTLLICLHSVIDVVPRLSSLLPLIA